MYSVLLENNLIEDPFVGLNSRELTKYSEKDCSFCTVINADSELLERKRIFLVFEGLDTLCDVYVNGTFAGNANNMHRTWRFSVKELLHIGENTVRLDFHSPLLAIKKAQARHELIGNSDTVAGFPHIRKASYMFGWDWSPTLPDMSIWRDAYLVAYDESLIDGVDVKQTHNEDGSVLLSVCVEPSEDCDGVCASFELTSPDGATVTNQSSACDTEFLVEEPMLWWPNGYGEQNLYILTVNLYKNGELLDSACKRVGLRTVVVKTERDEWGREFCFCVNGVDIFAMGANYVPEDNLITRYSRERTEHLIKECAKANFNMLRVWGGGIYPSDYFFDLCDEYGILVWQDFMFACATLWLTEGFKSNVVEECIDNIKRIRHHASLALLCGNNEMELAVDKWRRYSNNLSVRNDYLELFECVIPELCEKYAPAVFYWQSSPSSGGGFENLCDENFGDSHFWKVWLGKEPIEEYTKYKFRFLSEFGFVSLPDMKTVEYFADREERNLFSEVMDGHQKIKKGNSTLTFYLSQYYLYPQTMEHICYASQLLHAYAMRTAVEHLRRNREVCRGALYWMLNDCWPCISLSSVDYFGRLKALHYAARKFFAPMLVSAHKKGSRVTLAVSNETRGEFCGRLEYAVRANDFSVVYQGSAICNCDALSATDIITKDFSTIVGERNKEVFLEYSLYSDAGELMYKDSILFTVQKYYKYAKPMFSFEIQKDGENILLDISSSCYAENVFIEIEDERSCEISRQFFSITSSKAERVMIKGVDEAERICDRIKITSVYDIGR